jgi:hypothetical protein
MCLLLQNLSIGGTEIATTAADWNMRWQRFMTEQMQVPALKQGRNQFDDARSIWANQIGLQLTS